jgi:hypothetical protein
MRLTDYTTKRDELNSVTTLVAQLVVAFAICWAVGTALSGCTTIDQAKAYSIIQGVK